MAPREFLAGHPLKTGERFTTEVRQRPDTTDES
jgi:hypothetical protein